MAELRTPNGKVLGLIPTGIMVLCELVSFSKTHQLPTVLVKPRKRWLCPDVTEKLLTGKLILNTNKQSALCHFLTVCKTLLGVFLLFCFKKSILSKTNFCPKY